MRVMVWRRWARYEDISDGEGLPTGSLVERTDGGSQGEAMEYDCDSAYVRDGALTIIYTEGGDRVQHGIPLDTLAEWDIREPVEPPMGPPPLPGSGATAVHAGRR